MSEAATDHLNTSPLSTPISRAALRTYRTDRIRRGGVPWSARRRFAPIVAVFGAAALVVAVVLEIGMRSDLGAPTPAFIVIGGVLLLVAAGVLAASDWASWHRWARLDAFAAANGMTFTPTADPDAELGMIFGVGQSRRIDDHMALGKGWLDGRVETALASYTTREGSGETQRTVTHRWTYLVIQLDRNLPAMVLDAVENDNRLFGFGGSDLPTRLDGRQRLRLEGNFDDYFRLFVPTGYERDALYVFTPDLMALLIDHAGGGGAFDVEIVDDQMYFYAPRTLDFTDPDVWRRLTAIVATVGAKTLRQTVRYADDRVGNPRADVVAPAGRRLRQSPGAFAGAAIVVTIAIVGGVLLLVAR